MAKQTTAQPNLNELVALIRKKTGHSKRRIAAALNISEQWLGMMLKKERDGIPIKDDLYLRLLTVYHKQVKEDQILNVATEKILRVLWEKITRLEANTAWLVMRELERMTEEEQQDALEAIQADAERRYDESPTSGLS